MRGQCHVRLAFGKEREGKKRKGRSFAFATFGGLHADALALLKRLWGLLNQAIIALEDKEEYYVPCRVSFIIAAAVGCQLSARTV